MEEVKNKASLSVFSPLLSRTRPCALTEADQHHGQRHTRVQHLGQRLALGVEEDDCSLLTAALDTSVAAHRFH